MWRLTKITPLFPIQKVKFPSIFLGIFCNFCGTSEYLFIYLFRHFSLNQNIRSTVTLLENSDSDSSTRTVHSVSRDHLEICVCPWITDWQRHTPQISLPIDKWGWIISEVGCCSHLRYFCPRCAGFSFSKR